MSIPVLYSNDTPNLNLNTVSTWFNTAGSVITALDAALINGINSVDIVSINRSGSIAVIETSTTHTFKIGDTVHVEGTGVVNFDIKAKIHQIIDTTHISIKVQNSGDLSSGAGGTVKLAAAGFTKIYAGANIAVYRTAKFSDGLARDIQIEDNSPTGQAYYFRVRICIGWTALDTATKLYPSKIFTKGTSGSNSNSVWCVVADNKTIHLFTFGQNLQSLGAASSLSDNSDIGYISNGTAASSYGIGFGTRTNSASSPSNTNTNITIFDSIYSVNNITYGVTTILNRIDSGGNLGTYQNTLRAFDYPEGKMMVTDIKIAEYVGGSPIITNSQIMLLTLKAKGLYQPYSNLPVVLYNLSSYYYIVRFKEDDDNYRDMMFYNVYSTSGGNHMAVDLTEW